jgi:putative methionine-R-sulfoxide reductase with GAF domain
MSSLSVQTFLNDFVFRDCRLADHPKVVAQICWREGDMLVIGESVPTRVHTSELRIPLGDSLVGYAFRERRAAVVLDASAKSFVPLPFVEQFRSEVAVPIITAKTVVVSHWDNGD